MKLLTALSVLALVVGCGDESDSNPGSETPMCAEKTDAEWMTVEEARGAECAQCLRDLYPPLGTTCDEEAREAMCSDKCPPANRII